MCDVWTNSQFRAAVWNLCVSSIRRANVIRDSFCYNFIRLMASRHSKHDGKMLLNFCLHNFLTYAVHKSALISANCVLITATGSFNGPFILRKKTSYL